jgi:hypothetical protein
MEHPPQLNQYQVIHSTTLRFTATAAASLTVSPANVLDSMLVATTAIAGFQLFDAFKIKRIEAWGILAQGTPSTVEIQYANPTGDVAVHTDTSLGVRPAYVTARPSKLSLASFWTVSGGNPLFSLVVPAGAIIDIHVNFRTSSQGPVAVANALVGAAPGEFYFRGLDGLATAATNFHPPNGVQVQ